MSIRVPYDKSQDPGRILAPLAKYPCDEIKYSVFLHTRKTGILLPVF